MCKFQSNFFGARMPSAVDLAFVVLFTIVIMLYETYVDFPRLKARIAARAPCARRNAYRRTIVGQWLFAAAGIAIWIMYGRDWRAIGLVPAGGVRLWIGLGLIAFAIAFYLTQLTALRHTSAEQRAALRPRAGSVEFILPRAPNEYRWFLGLSVTAGICEELLYRGYLMWVFRAYMNLPIAIVLSSVLFGVAHKYQGRKGMAKTGAVGLVMNLIVVASGWLVPAMVLHAMVDMIGGAFGYTVLERES